MRRLWATLGKGGGVTPRQRRNALVLVLVVMVAFAVGLGVVATGTDPRSAPGRGQGRGAGSGVEPAPERPVNVAPEPPRAPLTGVTVEDVAALDHPAVAIKISDVPQAHPQVGVDRADIVFVEPIGASYTRLAAVFHSDLPDTVGPVRSVRVMDAALLGPLSPVFGNTMGAQWVVEHVDAVADLDDLGTLRVRGSGAYVLDGQRPPPDHVFARPQVLLGLSALTAPPAPYFQHAADATASSAVSAGGSGRSAEVPYGPQYRVQWRYDETAGRYLRAQPWGPHITSDGVQVGAVNVLILEVAMVTESIGEGGAPVQVPHLVDGSGRFVALSGGRAVHGTWSKGAVNEPFQLRTDGGDDLLLAPGNTWVELPAPSAGVTTQ